MSKRVLIAPNAFKGTLTAMEAAEIIAAVYREVHSDFDLELCPIADGGDGTCELLTELIPLEKISIWTFDPLGRPILGSFGMDKNTKTAYVDVSSVSGVGLLQTHEKDARITSTFGTGRLIANAIDQGAKTIVLGLGGSATIDLGLGVLQALGVTFLNQKGRELIPSTPDILKKIKHIQLNRPLPKIKIICLCDVNNTFFGEEGAIRVFGPQKGIGAEGFETVNESARQLIELFYKKTQKRFVDQEGFGAAGGIAFGLSFFFSVEIDKGAPYFFKNVKIREKVRNADYVITGEGKYDSQSSGGKGSFELKKIMDSEQKVGALITSGDEGARSGFQDFIQLPDLDFNSSSLKQDAAKNLSIAVRRYLQED